MVPDSIQMQGRLEEIQDDINGRLHEIAQHRRALDSLRQERLDLETSLGEVFLQGATPAPKEPPAPTAEVSAERAAEQPASASAQPSASDPTRPSHPAAHA